MYERGIVYENTRLWIEESIMIGAIKLWLREDAPDGSFNFHIEDGKIIRTQFDPMMAEETLLPLIKLPMPLACFLLKGILEHTESKGIKTMDTNKAEGMLQAKKEHLEDMREINTKLLEKLLK